MAALMRLPGRQRQVVALRLFLDLDTSRTAEMLGIAPGTVQARLGGAILDGHQAGRGNISVTIRELRDPAGLPAPPSSRYQLILIHPAALPIGAGGQIVSAPRPPSSLVDARAWSWSRELTVAEVVGLQFSYSFSIPALFGDRTKEFSDAVLALHPSGVVTEPFRIEVLVATR